MNIFPAIDLFDGKAVRLFKGDYNQMTVYSEGPLSVAKEFERKGASHIHLVDLEGAKDGTTPNIEIVKQIANNTSLFTEIGGGIRSMETVEKYLNCGVDRVILGTAAVTDEHFLKEAVKKYNDKIAVGVDIKDGFVAIKGWLEKSQYNCFDFCKRASERGIISVMRLWNLGGLDEKNAYILDKMKKAFPDEWKEVYSGYKLCDKVFLEWGEKFDWPDIEGEELGQDHTCYGLRDQIGVLSNGTVVPCCLDADGSIPLGNIFESDLSDILSGERAQALKTSLERRRVTEALCVRCGYARKKKY